MDNVCVLFRAHSDYLLQSELFLHKKLASFLIDNV